MLTGITNFGEDGLPIQWFHTLRLAQSHLTAASQIVYMTIATLHMETYRESPHPSFPVCDTESALPWGQLGLACETTHTCTHIHTHMQALSTTCVR